MMNEHLRAAIAANLTPVRPLPPPALRAALLLPVGVLLLFAAPLIFDFRDLDALGWRWSIAASSVEMLAGIGVVMLALREAIPGRAASSRVMSALAAGVAVLFIGITLASWQASPVSLRGHWWEISGICLVMSAASALPAVALSSVLIVRAFPLRPALAGGVAGFGSGLMADAGWRLFCHFSEPAHVVAAHFGGVLVAALTGAALVTILDRRRDRS
jgi:hypothetical protein